VRLLGAEILLKPSFDSDCSSAVIPVLGRALMYSPSQIGGER